ncbi:hypothetical protein C8J57DRAFT_1250649 [Mycena rebaudengoi]|nr:hypothetical protein C8J57DRAFT_1250649 [Mycena rebaudengoi]
MCFLSTHFLTILVSFFVNPVIERAVLHVYPTSHSGARRDVVSSPGMVHVRTWYFYKAAGRTAVLLFLPNLETAWSGCNELGLGLLGGLGVVGVKSYATPMTSALVYPSQSGSSVHGVEAPFLVLSECLYMTVSEILDQSLCRVSHKSRKPSGSCGMSRSYSGRLMSCHAIVWHDIQTPPSGHAALKVFSFTLPSPFPRLCHLDSKPRSTANTARFKTYYCKPRGQLPSLLPFRAYQAADVVSSLHATAPSSFMPQASSLQTNSFKSLQASSPKQTEASHQTIYVLVLSSASFTPLFDVKPPQDSRYVRIALYAFVLVTQYIIVIVFALPMAVLGISEFSYDYGSYWCYGVAGGVYDDHRATSVFPDGPVCAAGASPPQRSPPCTLEPVPQECYQEQTVEPLLQ